MSSSPLLPQNTGLRSTPCDYSAACVGELHIAAPIPFWGRDRAASASVQYYRRGSADISQNGTGTDRADSNAGMQTNLYPRPSPCMPEFEGHLITVGHRIRKYCRIIHISTSLTYGA